MLNTIELKYIDKWTREYPLVFHWGWLDGYGLSMKEAMQNPGFG